LEYFLNPPILNLSSFSKFKSFAMKKQKMKTLTFSFSSWMINCWSLLLSNLLRLLYIIRSFIHAKKDPFAPTSWTRVQYEFTINNITIVNVKIYFLTICEFLKRWFKWSFCLMNELILKNIMPTMITSNLIIDLFLKYSSFQNKYNKFKTCNMTKVLWQQGIIF